MLHLDAQSAFIRLDPNIVYELLSSIFTVFLQTNLPWQLLCLVYHYISNLRLYENHQVLLFDPNPIALQP